MAGNIMHAPFAAMQQRSGMPSSSKTDPRITRTPYPPPPPPHPPTRPTFLRTGDLARLDSGGRIYIAGRIKDLIIVRGRNLYPQVGRLTLFND